MLKVHTPEQYLVLILHLFRQLVFSLRTFEDYFKHSPVPQISKVPLFALFSAYDLSFSQRSNSSGHELPLLSNTRTSNLPVAIPILSPFLPLEREMCPHIKRLCLYLFSVSQLFLPIRNLILLSLVSSASSFLLILPII